MNNQVILNVTMKLCSDAILASGSSIAGGEDIAICVDEKGYPYVKGTTLKGLLRESVNNLVAWGAYPDSVAELFGVEDFAGAAGQRRLCFTSLTLVNAPADPADCTGERIFTRLEDGMVKEGTLRSAACIYEGTVFAGKIFCDKQDVSLVKDALAGIKWAGTLRSRGFGRVRFTCERSTATTKNTLSPLKPCTCIRYRLHTELPVLITNLARSNFNNQFTQGFLSGSAVRGVVMSYLALYRPEWLEEHRVELLGEKVRFLNALPYQKEAPTIPTIKGYYENKLTGSIYSILNQENPNEGDKRAKLGTFCFLRENSLVHWSTHTASALRIKRKTEQDDPQLFNNQFICAGQDFEGYILLDNPQLAMEISSVFTQDVWLGADRYEGFGRCSVTALEAVERPTIYEKTTVPNNPTLCMLLMSPAVMLDDKGNACGIDTVQLAKLLGVGKVAIQKCSTSVSEYTSFNRTWQCFSPTMRMYDAGSVFRLELDSIPSADALERVQRRGIGIRCNEGFGQVVFLPFDSITAINAAAELTAKSKAEASTSSVAMVRRKRLQWIMENAKTVKGWTLSKSQLGNIQAVCESSRSKRELDRFFDHNMQNRGSEYKARFEKCHRFMDKVLTQPLSQTLHCSEVRVDREQDKLNLLCELFNFSRKSEEGGN